MNTFSNMEINDLLSNRLRLEEKHTPNYLAECFQRLFPTLGRMGLSTVVDEMARANSRCFGAMDGDMPSGAGMRHCEANSSRLPVRGETLDLGFFFELWRRSHTARPCACGTCAIHSLGISDLRAVAVINLPLAMS